jgi:hypothetical protein
MDLLLDLPTCTRLELVEPSYNQFDLFSLSVNRSAHSPATFIRRP